MSGERDPISQRLTLSQQQIWLAHQIAESAALNVPVIVRIAAALDPDALSKAFQALVDTSDVLRMIVVPDRGTPKALLLPHIDAPVAIVTADGDPERFVQRWVADRSELPFRLDERLFDAALIVLPDNRSVFYLNQHHLITDGWSVHLAVRRLGGLYEAFRNDESPQSQTSPGFGEYVDWCYSRDGDAERNVEAGYWKRTLALPAPVPALYGRSQRSEGRHAFELSFPFGIERSERIYAAAAGLATGERSLDRAVVAVFGTCLAAYEARVSGVSRVAIGIPYRNRPPRFEETLGPFANVVPLIASIDPSASFASTLDVVYADMIAAFNHGRHPVPHSRAQPAYHTLLNYRAEDIRSFAGIPASLRFCFSRRADEPLALHINRLPETREFAVDFVLGDDVFDRERGERSIEHFMRMLDACIADPRQLISDPPLVTEAERGRLLAWSRSSHRRVVPAASCTRMIEAAALERPDAVAVEDGALRLTYRDFVGKASAIAWRLRELGVRAETPVGIAMERSSATCSAILGVLLAGGAYVPLDPLGPETRLKLMLEDADVRHVITDDLHRPALAAIDGCPAQLVALEDLANGRADGPLPGRDPDQLAYVIFTSGSTGRPKAVAITDRSMANHSLACRRLFSMTEHDRVLQFRTLTFDASIEEMFPAWTSGATLVLGPRTLAVDLDEFTAFVAANRITVMDLPTAFWHEWVRALGASNRSVSPALRVVAVGGEQPSARLLQQWARQGGDRLRWVNMYGPTETSVTALSYEATTFSEDPVPIGSPIDHATAFILDSHRRMVPIGVPGTLYVGGAGLARGYVNSPDLTARRFVPSPFEIGERLYITGDLARHREDGQIEYLGRMDDQVKIRGFRVEPAEVEHVLAEHADVDHAVVLPRRHAGDQIQLAAYVAVRRAVQPSDLREFLQQRLPDYMVPSVILTLERIPLTERGKVDRDALTAIEVAPTAPGQEKVRPRADLVVTQLLALWKELLGVPDVAVDDTFIALGGHSLLGARMLYEISERFGRKLPFSVLFPDVTVEKLARALQQAPSDPMLAPVQALRIDGSRPPLFFFHGDYSTGGLYAARLAKLLGPDQPLYVVHPHGAGGESVPATIEEMADDRLADILAARPDGPLIVGGYCNGGLVAYETALRLSRVGREVLATILIDASVRTTRFRALSRGIQRYAAYRGLTPRQARDRFLVWRDRQITFEQLINLRDHSRFRGIADRLAFVAGNVVRKFPGEETAPDSNRQAAASSRTKLEDPWAAYVAAMDAYTPSATSMKVVLLLSDDLLSRGADQGWRRLAQNIVVTRIEGGHFEAVTQHLATLARAVADASRYTRGSIEG